MEKEINEFQNKILSVMLQYHNEELSKEILNDLFEIIRDTSGDVFGEAVEKDFE